MSEMVRRPVERVLEAARPPKREGLHVDSEGFVCVGGVRVARLVERDGTRLLQFADRCKWRSARRGTRYVEVPVSEVAELNKAAGDGIISGEGKSDELL